MMVIGVGDRGEVSGLAKSGIAECLGSDSGVRMQKYWLEH